MMLIADEFEENDPETNTHEKKITPEEKYPEICQYVYNKYPKVKVYKIFDLDFNLYMVETLLGKIILEKKEEKTKEWYIIDEEPFKFLLYSDIFEEKDLNNDGYLDLILEYWDTPFIYYYILSLKPEGYELITQVDENGNTLVWTERDFGFLDIWDYEGEIHKIK